MVARAQDVLTDPCRILRSIVEMPHLHLPADHDDQDRQLAASLARVLRSSELYVTWSEGRGGARPVVLTACAAPRRRRGLARLRDVFAPRRAV
jgi:hypothetical protein